MSEQPEATAASDEPLHPVAGERLVAHHLVQADDGLSEFHRYRNYWTVCGQVLKTESLPSSLCECGLGDECREVVVYCQACRRDAARHNAELGVPGE